ncbi:MAG: DNA primase family protein, partial [Terriglobia bacterium]
MRVTLAGKEDVIDFLWKAIGYSLTGDTQEDCLFLLYGAGANGKSTFLNILRALLGEYGKQAAFSTFLYQERDAVRNDLADLRGARLVVASEAEEGKRLSESLIKALTGRDLIKTRFLFQEHFEFIPQMKLWLAANHKPVIRGTDYAIWRRIRLLPFTETFQGEACDKGLPDKLKAELLGIFAWAVRGCLAWQRDGLPLPQSVKAATEEYRSDMDAVACFLEEKCICRPESTVPSSVLYGAYS